MSFKRCIFIFVFIFLTGQFIFLFMSKQYFTVTDVEVNGASHLLNGNIVKTFETMKGTNIWEIDLKNITEEILKDVRIKSIKIVKKIPDKIFIDITEETPYLNVLYNGEIYISNENGKIFTFMNEIEKKDFIIAEIRNEQELKDIVEVIKKMEGTKLPDIISEIYINKFEVLLLLKDGTKIKVNKSVTKKKYEEMLKLYSYLKNERKKIEYIDLRFRDYIVK